MAQVGIGRRRADACDVVVVGAGLVGAAVAGRLTRQGFRTALLEAQQASGGSSVRSAGMVVMGLPGHYSWAVSAYGRSRAREVWELTVEGRERLVETADALGSPAARTGSLVLAVDDAEAAALKESEALLREDGFDVQLDPAGDPLGRGFRAALRQPADVMVDAAMLARALLASSGAVVHEGTEVQGLEPATSGMRVWAHGRTVLCDAVVLTLNGYAPLLDSYFVDKVTPARSFTLLTPPLGSVVLEQPCSVDYGYECCCQLPDRRLLLGSWRRARGSAELEDAAQDGLVRFALRHFPEVDLKRAIRKSGILGLTPDGLPMVGFLPHMPQVYFAVGLGARGLAWALVVAERLVELMLRDKHPGLVSATRFSV